MDTLDVIAVQLSRKKVKIEGKKGVLHSSVVLNFAMYVSGNVTGGEGERVDGTCGYCILMSSKIACLLSVLSISGTWVDWCTGTSTERGPVWHVAFCRLWLRRYAVVSFLISQH